MKLWHILKLMIHVVRGVISPTNLKHSVRAGAVLCESGVLETTVRKIRQMPNGTWFFAQRNFDFNHGLDFFAKFPEGSLGKSYYDHCLKFGLDPDAFPKIKVHDDASYVEHVIRHVHDVWHVLTGFDVSISGELGLQAFKAKQINWPFAMVGIGGGSFVTLFKTPEEIENLVDQIVRGGQMGAACKPLMTMDWNDRWGDQLDIVRRELGLESFFTSSATLPEKHNITYQQSKSSTKKTLKLSFEAVPTYPFV